MIALQKILVIACPSHANNTGKVSIVIRENLKIAKEYLGEDKNYEMGMELEAIESDDGL